MRATITEQLDGSARILEETVAPVTESPYAAEVLRGVIKNLRMLAGSWDKVAPFLHWDNLAMCDLLRRLQPVVSTERVGRIQAILDDVSTSGSDTDATHRLNTQLRGELAAIARAFDPDDERTASLHAALVAHLVVRIERYPMRMAIAMPRGSTGGGADAD